MIRYIRELLVILILLTAGLLAEKAIPFPGSLISMILFLTLMQAGVIQEEYFVGGLSDLILKNLSFFFLPPAVRVVESLDLLKGVWVKLIIIMFISNALVMGVTGLVVQLFLKKEEHDG